MGQLADNSIVFWSLMFVLGLMGALALASLPRIWRKPTSWETSGEVPIWWPYGEDAFRAWLRALPMGCIAYALMVVIAVLGRLGGTVAVIPIFFCGLGFFAFVLVCTTVALYNRPRRVVPPRFRGDMGLAEIARARRPERQRA